jgi:polyhydroxyalkanoate synthesis regulator phasin
MSSPEESVVTYCIDKEQIKNINTIEALTKKVDELERKLISLEEKVFTLESKERLNHGLL